MLDRREFIRGLAAGAILTAAGPRRIWAAQEPSLPDATRSALESSPYVYVSPLRSDGQESRCHAEVWYAWIDGAVVMTVSTDGWKSQAVARGLDRARIWVGDHGRLKGLNSRSTAFRKAPHFDARAERTWDPALLDELLKRYDTKYPEEIGRWRDRMRQGNSDRTRVMIRYSPVS
ncbi:MAG: hypothetical protein ACQGVK_14415 [Myxococcota bacterium]